MSTSVGQLAAASASKPGLAGSLVRGLWPVLLALALAMLMQRVVKPGVDPYSAQLLLAIGINVVLAVSLTIVNGFTGQFSMGHAGFFAIGGYASGVLTYYWSLRNWGSTQMVGGALSGMPLQVPEGVAWITGADALFVAALLVGGLVSAGLGYLVGLPSLRLRGDYLAIVTLGFGEIVRVLITQTGPVISSAEAAARTPLWRLPGAVGGALGFNGLPAYNSLFWVYLVVGITLIAAYRLKVSTFGRAMLSIREDEIAAEAMGVNTTRYKVWAFVIAAFFAGVAGGLSAHTLGVGLGPTTAGFLKSFDIIIMVVLGGLGSISGAALAAVIITLLPEYLRGIENYRMIVFALALILVMIFRPQGLLGVKEIWEKSAWRWLFRLLGRGGPS